MNTWRSLFTYFQSVTKMAFPIFMTIADTCRTLSKPTPTQTGSVSYEIWKTYNFQFLFKTKQEIFKCPVIFWWHRFYKKSIDFRDWKMIELKPLKQIGFFIWRSLTRMYSVKRLFSNIWEHIWHLHISKITLHSRCFLANLVKLFWAAVL